jgi:predicted Zn-dependent protease
MIYSSDEAKKILEKILSMSKADEAEVSLGGGKNSHLRFAANAATTSGTVENLSISIRSTFGKRTGAYTVNQFDEKTLESAVRKSEEIARLAPEDPEFMPGLGPQTYEKVDAFDEETANVGPEFRANAAAVSIKSSEARNLISAGFVTDAAGFSAIANSKGLFGYHTSTRATYSCTARTKDGTGSGWVGRGYHKVAKVDAASFYLIAADKALRSANPRPLEPGVYEVVLEPSATADILSSFIFSLDARNADEGRSFFAKKGGGNKLGEKLFDEKVTLYTDPKDPEVPGTPYAFGGLPQKKTTWVENGLLKNLTYTRFWAEKQGKEPIPPPSNILMKGGEATIEDLIKSVKRGVLVSTLWYIRSLDPQTMLVTGLTRDGNFYIEKGEIKYPVNNFRWNESPAFIFSNVVGMTKSMRVMGKESGNANVSAPAMLVKEFHFSSVSDAV